MPLAEICLVSFSCILVAVRGSVLSLASRLVLVDDTVRTVVSLAAVNTIYTCGAAQNKIKKKKNNKKKKKGNDNKAMKFENENSNSL